MRKSFIIIFITVFAYNFALAQRDTVGSVTITSAYKPVLRNAAKINFSGTAMPEDTSRKVQPYQVPAYNLHYAYQPVVLRALPLEPDTNLQLGNRNFVKAGFGNYSTPFVHAGFSIGDGKKTLVNVLAKYISSKGKDLKYQDFGDVDFGVSVNHTVGNQEAFGKLFYEGKQYYRYGAKPVGYVLSKDALANRFFNAGAKLGFKNIADNNLHITYNPNIAVSFFSLRNHLTETNFSALLPVEKNFSDKIDVGAKIYADISKSVQKDTVANGFNFSNNVVSITPYVKVQTDYLNIQAGISPTWNNSEFLLLPDVWLEAFPAGKSFSVIGGAKGSILKNNFANLLNDNPYLGIHNPVANTQQTEVYGGLKTTIANKFQLTGKAAWVNYKNLLLFMHDTVSTDARHGFSATNAASANNFRVSGDVAYTQPEKFSMSAGVTFNGYVNVKGFTKPWNMLPWELRSSAAYYWNKKLTLKADLCGFGSVEYLLANKVSGRTNAGADLSLGAEYSINKRFGAWLSANNLLNNKNSRWYGYPVYGVGLLAGVIARF